LSLGHSRRLLEEAAKDLKIGCYNKTESASYFALKRAIEALSRSWVSISLEGMISWLMP
jgi:uncharacterized protein (UPF0332 family)